MDEVKKIKLKIFSYDPEKDSKPSYKNFEVELDRGTTVLRAINYIKDHIDHELGIRFFCQAGICGSCSVKVNGVSKLACTTQVWEELTHLAEGEAITIDPLGNFDVIRDLIVDITPMWDKLEKYKTWVVPNMDEHNTGEKEFIISDEEFESTINAATDCILCASCYSECSITFGSEGKFISPLVMLKVHRMNIDRRDTLNNERLQLTEKDGGIWDCTHCYRCVEACVKNIPIMDAIQGLRHETCAAGMTGTPGYKHAKAFEDDIESVGRLKEITLPLRTLGPFGALKLIPFALSMGAKGRVPPIFPHKSDNLSNIKEIFRSYREQEKRK